ncbi:MAG: hypothetical protein U5K74_07460 [Gemmatimonadaceae bacterium]|nr:hypothetical protein [Gemmatimonadaceae bacterium]
MRAVGLAAGIAAFSLHGSPLTAQAPGGRLQFVLPPSTWRVTVSGEGAGRHRREVRCAPPCALPGRRSASTRATVRLSAPVWKRGLYTTIVTNDIIYDRFDMSYGQAIPLDPSRQTRVFFNSVPAAKRAARTGRVACHQSPMARDGCTPARILRRPPAPRSIPEATVQREAPSCSRVWIGPTLQVGAGVVALNVAPYVIPTIRILHVGQKWAHRHTHPACRVPFVMSDTVSRSAACSRFLGNRWGAGNDQPFFRTTFQQAMLGPAVTWRVADRRAAAVGDRRGNSAHAAGIRDRCAGNPGRQSV